MAQAHIVGLRPPAAPECASRGALAPVYRAMPRPFVACAGTLSARRPHHLGAPRRRGLIPRLAAALAAVPLLLALGQTRAGAAWQVPTRQSRLLRPSSSAREGRAPRRSAATALAEQTPPHTSPMLYSRSAIAAVEEVVGAHQRSTASKGLTPSEEERLRWVQARLSKLNARHEQVVAKQEVLAKEWEAVADRRKQPI
uniref:Uncharacterized protein n=1 Tax=Alexandrium catenella TaxID=2925 RepID=A0A7S1RJD6_ALECA